MYTPLISRTKCKLTLHCSLLQPPLLSYKLAFLFHLSIFHFCSILHFLFDHLSNLNFAPSSYAGDLVTCVHVWCGVRVRASCVNLDCFRFSDRRTVKNSRTSTRYVSNYVSYSLYRPAWRSTCLSCNGLFHLISVHPQASWMNRFQFPPHRRRNRGEGHRGHVSPQVFCLFHAHSICPILQIHTVPSQSKSLSYISAPWS